MSICKGKAWCPGSIPPVRENHRKPAGTFIHHSLSNTYADVCIAVHNVSVFCRSGVSIQNLIVVFIFLDRYVMLGNHRDSWVLGAVDPSSGTATMMELSRVLGQLVKDSEYMHHTIYSYRLILFILEISYITIRALLSISIFIKL